MICYKVVNNISNGKRISINCNISNYYCYEDYCLTYEKGKIVKAPEGTMGIFLFKKKDDAQLFISNLSIKSEDHISIIKVKNIGRLVERTLAVHPSNQSYFTKYLKLIRSHRLRYDNSYTWFVPKGTYTCKAVKVLE